MRKVLDPYSDIFGTAEMPLYHHASAALTKKVLARIGYPWDRFYSFTTIRNPWDRVVSAWAFGERNSDSVWRRRRDEAESFDDFCKAVPYTMAIDQFAFGDGARLVNEIVMLEKIDEQLPKVLARLEIAAPEAPKNGLFARLFDRTPAEPYRLQRENVSERSAYQEYYTKESRDHIAKLFAADIEMGEYSFE